MTKKKGRRLALALGLGAAVIAAAVVAFNWPHVRAKYILWSEFEPLGKNSKGYDEYRHRRSESVFILLPGALVTPREAKSFIELLLDLGVPVEAPLQDVELRPFLIEKDIVVAPEYYVDVDDLSDFPEERSSRRSPSSSSPPRPGPN